MINQEAPVVNEIPAKKDFKSLIKERKNLTQIIAGIFLALVILITVGIASWLILNKNILNNRLSSVQAPLSSISTTPTVSALSTDVRPTVAPTATPTPVPLPKGPQIYSVSAKNAIQVKELYINNLDTHIGDAQQFRLTIEDNAGSVNYVSVKLITDNKSTLHTLSLAFGAGASSVWQGSWTTDDQHDFKYQAQITIKDDKGNQFYFEPSFR